MLTHTSFGQTAVSAVRPALGTSSASRERPGMDHPHPLGLVWPCPLLFQPLTLSVGVRAPAPKLPVLASASRPPSAAQRPLGLGASTRCTERLATGLRRRFNTVTDEQTYAVKRRLTHLVPFSLRVSPRRASPHRGSDPALCRKRFARSSCRQLDTPDRQPATRLSKRSTRSRFDYRSPTTAASFALHGARPTSAPELVSRIGVIFQPETR
jgi:hypothetical protein